MAQSVFFPRADGRECDHDIFLLWLFGRLKFKITLDYPADDGDWIFRGNFGVDHHDVVSVSTGEYSDLRSARTCGDFYYDLSSLPTTVALASSCECRKNLAYPDIDGQSGLADFV